MARQPLLDFSTSMEGGDFNYFLNIMGDESIVLANKTAERMARRFQKEVINAILDQKYDLWPLSEDYAWYKERMGLDDRILIATGKMVSHIRVWKTLRGREQVLHVGIHPNAKYTKTTKEGDKRTIKVQLVARFLEFGTEKMMPRPVWTLTFNDLTRDLKTFRQWYARQLDNTARIKAGQKVQKGRPVGS